MPGPRTVLCFICGRQYGKSSIVIHQKSCQKLWEAQELKKPPHMRRKLEDIKPEVINTSGMSWEERQAAEAAAAAKAYDKQMAKCSVCSRTFLPDRLVIHQRSCRPGNAAKKVGAPTLGGAGAPNHVKRGGTVDIGGVVVSPSRPKSTSSTSRRPMPSEETGYRLRPASSSGAPESKRAPAPKKSGPKSVARTGPLDVRMTALEKQVDGMQRDITDIKNMLRMLTESGMTSGMSSARVVEVSHSAPYDDGWGKSALPPASVSHHVEYEESF